MKMLLTSAGIQNPSLKTTLLELLGKPIEECHALAITTASYAFPRGPFMAYQFLNGSSSTPMCELGWKSVGVLELSLLPSLEPSLWRTQVMAADVLLVNGGDPLFLHHWMVQSGFADCLKDFEGVYVGLSAASMIMAPRIGEEFVGWNPDHRSDQTLGWIDVSIFPHLDHPQLPDNILPTAKTWASKLGFPAYAIDDQTALKVVDGTIEVISEGQWHLL